MHTETDHPTDTDATTPDTYTALVELVQALDLRFPDHNTPAERLTRLLEEAGELAKIVNWAENTGIKADKYGEYDEDKMVKEIDDVLRTVMGLAVHYQLVDKVAASIAYHHGRHMQMGFIKPGPAPDLAAAR